MANKNNNHDLHNNNHGCRPGGDNQISSEILRDAEFFLVQLSTTAIVRDLGLDNIPKILQTEPIMKACLAYRVITQSRRGDLQQLCGGDLKELYKRFVHPLVIQTIWNEILKHLGSSRITIIGVDIGFTLFKHDTEEGTPLVAILLSKLYQYGEYLINDLNARKKSGYVSSKPSEDTLARFLEHYDHGSVARYNFTPFGARGTIQQADSVSKLLEFLPSAHLEDDKLMMSRKDTAALLTCPYVVRRHIMKLESELKPSSGKAIPLDQLACDKDGDVAFSEIPSIKAFMQENDIEDNIHCNIFVLRDFLSDEVMDNWQQMENSLLFQKSSQGNTNKYLRMSSKVQPPPLVIFGNNIQNLRAYEATQVGDIEEIVLKMAKYTFDLMDDVIDEVIHDITLCLQRRQRKKQRMTMESPCIRFQTKRDTPDSVVTLLSKGRKTYKHHTDTRPSKFDNHDNDDDMNPQLHEMFMRIFTLSFSTQSGDIITIQHGRPSEDKNHLYFKLWGHFCASTNTFIPCEEAKQLDGIKIGGKCHLHIQDVATQGDIHHFLHPIGSDEGIRSVKSVRHLESCNLSVGNRLDRKFGVHRPTVIAKGNHTLGEIVDKMNNHVVFPLIGDDLDDQRDTQLANGEDNRETPPTFGREHRRKMIGPSTYRNGAILPVERTKRDFIIGLPPNVDIIDIAANHNYLCQYLMKHKKTLVYKNHKHIDSKSRRVVNVDIVCGPVLVSLEDGTKRRVRSGEYIPPELLSLISGIHSSNSCKGVVDVKRMYVLDLKLLSKNSASVGKNLLSALKGGRLSEMVVRGVGGSMDIAGSTPVPLSSKNAQRDACSHFVSHTQQLGHPFTIGMFDAMRRQQPINCFLFNMFIGIFCVKEVIVHGGESDETIGEEMIEMQNVLNDLKDSRLIPVGATVPASLTEQDRRQIGSMSCPGVRVKLVPLEPSFPSEYPLSKPRQDCLWGTVELKEEHFVRPSLFVEKPVIDDVWGNSFNTRKLFDELKKRGQIFAHLTPKGRSIVKGEIYDDNESDENGNDDESGSADEIQSIPFSSPSQVISLVWNVLVHTSFWSFQKAVDSSMIDNDTNSIIPPRSFLMDTFGEDCYSETLEALNLKPMLSRPLHPPLLSILDPVVNLIMQATNTNPETRRVRGDGITFIERCDEAWGIILKCTICVFLNSSALLEITEGDISKLPNPMPMEVNHFIQKIKEFEWSARIVHPLFRKIFTDMDCLISFVRKFSDKGKGIFREVVRVKSQSRSEMLVKLGRQIYSATDIKFNAFQLQVIARGIEIPIDHPFGEVQHVSCGYGSTEATKLFTTAYKEDNKGSERQSTDAATHQQVLPWLLYKIVEFVGDKIGKGDPFIQDELTLMRLTWTNDTLSHLDTGKKVDESDIEHLLCCIYVLIQHTFPSRNMAKVNYIDGEKYHPICFGSDGKKAIDLPLMQTFREKNGVMRDAYERLIRNEDYPFRFDSTFEIDLSVATNSSTETGL